MPSQALRLISLFRTIVLAGVTALLTSCFRNSKTRVGRPTLPTKFGEAVPN